ncbi:DUF2905 domain-containing protein [Priestia megaterium]|uniref:DUF2905 domain-containing protein n=1 Tax=Priestia megaterium TaxID=1404 RepID=UPI0003499D34|nr:DUF2905 domain-containing protein [Priestia megaterium]MBY0197574.1 DUF2905 domain-containing protein [Priestia megaterium]MCE4091226.1 DUF2905 domain-containing protein [Priestia megaterium]MCR8928522.1 DUF2905 domain-containing protein [Priestia megaterium]MDH3158071.1 DUF2905 domain-containing protein [Priestia megaterium]MDQ0807324.1 hypothetical protein [Priestia megaterium]
MNDMPKMLITLGGILVVIGLLWQFVGKLPGDIFIKKGNTTFYFPVVTCILVSVVLSLIFYVIGKFK